MKLHKPNHIAASIYAPVFVLLASGTTSAQLISNPQTAKHYSATAFISGSAEIDARFGYALAVGDFNDDGFDDLAIGVPYQPYQGDYDRSGGAVIVAYGAWDGLDSDDALPAPGIILYGAWDGLDSDDALPAPGIILYGGIGGPPQHLERFGWSLAVGDFDGNGYDDLAVGAPGFDITYDAAGAVYTFSGGIVGLSTVADIRWSQAVLAGTPESSEQFGHALAAGDINGDGLDDLAIGIPGDVVNGVAQGSVAVLYANAGGLAVPGNELWNQESQSVEGVGESGDLFGWSLAIGSINLHGNQDLLIGSPGEDVGSLSDAGTVNYLFGTSNGLVTSELGGISAIITQNWFGDSNEPAEADDFFGSNMHFVGTYLYIGASGEDDGYNNRGLLQSIDAAFPDPNPSFVGLNRYGAPGGGLGGGNMASAFLYHVPESHSNKTVLVSGEPGFMSGRGALRIAPLNPDETVGASYFSNAFGLTPQENAHFGKAVAVGNFNGRGVPEIVISTPLWDYCIPFDPPICSPDRGLITVVDDTLFADGLD